MTYEIPETLMANLLEFLQRNSTGNDEADAFYQELVLIKSYKKTARITISR